MSEVTVETPHPANRNVETRIYKKRFFMLAMFVALSASNALQWIEYSIIAGIVVDFYGVSYDAVNWTSMIYMLMYVILVFPGSWFLDKYGLRTSLLIGAFDKFVLTFIAQTIVGSSQVFILGIPPRLAAVWFGPEQVSTACAAGVFGNQLGIAIGFVLPPWIVHSGTVASMGSQLGTMFLISAIANSLILIIIVIFFREKPELPPSLAQIKAIQESVDHNFSASLKNLCTNWNYILLLITYGINVGVFYAVSTLLSQMVLSFHPKAESEVGTIGLVIVVAGMLGSVVGGYVLDRFHKYKATTMLVYVLSFAGMALFTFTLHLDLWIIYASSAALGFFMTGYLPIGFEFAAELTFPIAEGTTSGLLNGAVQILGVLMTFGMGKLIYVLSIFWANVIMCGCLFAGIFLTALIKSDLRRQRAHREQRPDSAANTRSETVLTNC